MQQKKIVGFISEKLLDILAPKDKEEERKELARLEKIEREARDEQQAHGITFVL